MKTLKSLMAGLLALVLTSSAAMAQDRVPFRQEELDQMLAPIALYPDSLLSQILMASTYPLEVVQASRWSRANPDFRGQDAVRAVERMDWDPSVKSLTAFPQILTMMDEKIDWTEQLGEAFLAQQADVMDTVQGLRRRAEAAGNLGTNDRMRVLHRDGAIYIDPPAPQVVYVPYYDPFIVYGPWWWPAYPPVFWAPPPAYYVVPGYRPAFLWGSGVFISVGFFFGHTDWHRHHVTVANNVIVNRTTIVNPPAARVVWQHNPDHRRGVPFRREAARQRFEQSRIAATDTRRDADRNGPPQAARRTDDSRTADIRQRRMEERRDTARDHRENGRGEQRESVTTPLAPNGDGNRAAGNRAESVAKSSPQAPTRDARPETRGAPQSELRTQPETRRPQPEGRPGRPDTALQGRPDRVAPQASQVPERNDARRPQGRSADPRPNAVTPSHPESRVAREAAPAPAPRPQTAPATLPPQADNNTHRGAARDHGNPRERSNNRDNDRKS